MQWKARIKWAACGFVAGFLVCYLLETKLWQQPTIPPSLASGPSSWVPMVISLPPFGQTNSPQFDAQGGPRNIYRRPFPLRPEQLQERSLDLIDTLYQLPREGLEIK